MCRINRGANTFVGIRRWTRARHEHVGREQLGGWLECEPGDALIARRGRLRDASDPQLRPLEAEYGDLGPGSGRAEAERAANAIHQGEVRLDGYGIVGPRDRLDRSLITR